MFFSLIFCIIFNGFAPLLQLKISEIVFAGRHTLSIRKLFFVVSFCIYFVSFFKSSLIILIPAGEFIGASLSRAFIFLVSKLYV